MQHMQLENHCNHQFDEPLPANELLVQDAHCLCLQLLFIQVGFFGGICIPCYDLLSKVMPSVQPMLEQVLKSLMIFFKNIPAVHFQCGSVERFES